MKRFLSILFCAILVCSFAGCGESKEEQERIQRELQMLKDNAEEDIEPEPICDTLGLTLDDFKQLYANNEDVTFNDFITYTTDEFIVSKEKDSYGTMCFVEPGNSEIGMVYFLANNNGAQQHKNKVAQKRTAVADYCDKNGIDYITGEFVEGDVMLAVIAAKDCKLYDDLPSSSIQDLRDDSEFFADETRREQFSQFLRNLDYAGLAVYLDDFIATHEITENDCVQQLKEDTEILSQLLSGCVVQKDEFEGTAQIYYSGIQNLNYNTCIVPYGKTSSTSESLSFYCTTGIVQYDWLFFDHLALKGANDIIEKSNPSYDSVTRDVLENGNITEWLDMSSWKKGFETVIEENTGTIRFENTESGETVDHILTSEEISALSTILQIYTYHSAIAQELFLWEYM